MLALGVVCAPLARMAPVVLRCRRPPVVLVGSSAGLAAVALADGHPHGAVVRSGRPGGSGSDLPGRAAPSAAEPGPAASARNPIPAAGGAADLPGRRRPAAVLPWAHPPGTRPPAAHRRVGPLRGRQRGRLPAEPPRQRARLRSRPASPAGAAPGGRVPALPRARLDGGGPDGAATEPGRSGTGRLKNVRG